MPHLITPHFETAMGYQIYFICLLLHIILVNKDLCFTLNAHRISNSEYFFVFFFLVFFSSSTFSLLPSICWTSPNTKGKTHLFNFFHVSFSLSKTKKPNLNTVNSIVPFSLFFLSPRGNARIVHENSHCTGLCSVRCRGGVSAWEYTSSIFG